MQSGTTQTSSKAEENILGVLNRHQPAQEDVSSMRDLEHLTEDNDISKEELAGEEAHPGEVQDLKDEDHSPTRRPPTSRN